MFAWMRTDFPRQPGVPPPPPLTPPPGFHLSGFTGATVDYHAMLLLVDELIIRVPDDVMDHGERMAIQNHGRMRIMADILIHWERIYLERYFELWRVRHQEWRDRHM